MPANDGFHFEAYADIVFLEASGSYTTLHLKGKKKYMIARAPGDVEQMLPESQFCRVHNSFIIHVSHVSKYERGRGGYVIMSDGASMAVATRKKDDLLSMFKL